MKNLLRFPRRLVRWKMICWNSKTVSQNGKACHLSCVSKTLVQHLVSDTYYTTWPLVTMPLDRRKAQRSSVADLRVLYASQLQELHANIEGSAKFVPAIPGRHVISQTPDLYHLNPATYKVEYTVHWVLLDDSVLIAKQRRRRNGERGGLVAERCWNLSEVVIVDVKDTAGM